MLRTYQGLWRHTSLRDLLRLAQAVALGGVLAVLAILTVFRFQGYSRELSGYAWIPSQSNRGPVRPLAR